MKAMSGMKGKSAPAMKFSGKMKGGKGGMGGAASTKDVAKSPAKKFGKNC